MSDIRKSNAESFKAAGLQQRVITAVIIAAAFLALVIQATLFWFQLAICLIFLVAAWEWANLSGFARRITKTLYVLFVLVVAIVLHFAFKLAFFPVYLFVEPNHFYPVLVELLMLVAIMFWMIASVMVFLYPKSAVVFKSLIARAVMGLFVLLPTWAGVVFLKQQHENGGLLLWVVAIVAMADIGAYFVGVRFGKHKLASHVSPGKSWEGVLGGVLCNSIFVAVLALSWHLTSTEILMLFFVTLLVVFFSIIGDLFESMMKRHCGVKDSGSILPGHGGILDRIDGWMPAIPVFVLAYIVLAI